MFRITSDNVNEPALNWREQEIYQAVIRCLESRRQLIRQHAISGWVATVLIGGLVGLATHNLYLTVVGALIARWLARRLTWYVLRGAHELLGDLVLQLGREPCGAALVGKIDRGNAMFARGDRTGAAYAFHMMHDQILNPLCWSNGPLAEQFLLIHEPAPAVGCGIMGWPAPGNRTTAGSPFFN